MPSSASALKDIALINMNEVLRDVRSAFADNNLVDALDGGMFTRPLRRFEHARWKAETEAYRKLARADTRARRPKARA